MNSLAQVRQNIFYKKETSDGDLIKVHELIFLAATPEYHLNNQSEIVREHKLEEFRIGVTNKSLKELILTLQTYVDLKEEEMV